MRERVAIVGYSLALDFAMLSDGTVYSNFIMYEDALDYNLLWAKEFQLTLPTYPARDSFEV